MTPEVRAAEAEVRALTQALALAQYRLRAAQAREELDRRADAVALADRLIEALKAERRADRGAA